MIDFHKNELRRKLLHERVNHDEYQYLNQNENIIKKVKSLLDIQYLKFKKEINFSLNNKNIDEFDKNCGLGLYWPLKAEPDLIKLAISSKWCVGLPKIDNETIKIIRYQIGSPIEKSNFGKLYQPLGNMEIIPKVILIPGLAFSIKGYRLGFGKGHYDRYIAKISQNSEIITIGVCFHDKLFEYLPYDDHDIKLNYIVTDQTLIQL